jgi:hypothetical protein
MAQTGGLAGGGKASLLGIEIWRDQMCESNSASCGTTSHILRYLSRLEGSPPRLVCAEVRHDLE